MPQVILFAGANGSGKSTVAPYLLPRITIYLNADEFAKELQVSGSDTPDIAAGRLLFQRWDELEHQRADFAVETTLATRSFVPRLRQMRKAGYHFHLVFLWIPSPEIAIARVQERSRHGGHTLPEAVIRRRYASGLRNFFALYRPIANTWRLFDNSVLPLPTLIARGSLTIQKETLWNQIQTEWT